MNKIFCCFFSTIAFSNFAMNTEVKTTDYGTFVLHEPAEETILKHIECACSFHFAELRYDGTLNNKEQAIFDAYISARDPLAKLLNLAAKARTQKWHPAYNKALETLIACCKNP